MENEAENIVVARTQRQLAEDKTECVQLLFGGSLSSSRQRRRPKKNKINKFACECYQLSLLYYPFKMRVLAPAQCACNTCSLFMQYLYLYSLIAAYDLPNIFYFFRLSAICCHSLPPISLFCLLFYTFPCASTTTISLSHLEANRKRK